MFKILIDTCVWLDLAKDQRQVPVLGVVEEMVKLRGEIQYAGVATLRARVQAQETTRHDDGAIAGGAVGSNLECGGLAPLWSAAARRRILA